MSSRPARLRLAAREMPHPLVDAALAIGALAVTLALVRHGGVIPTEPGSGRLDPPGLALAAFSALPLLAWRYLPLTVFAVTATAAAALVGLGHAVDLTPGPTIALYLVAASSGPERRRTSRTAPAASGLFVAYAVVATAAQGGLPTLGLLHTGMAWAVAWFAGERTRLRREQLAELRERAVRAERDAERERQLAVAEERTRIARDLHDSAGHAINVIAVRAGGARLRHHQDPDRSLPALQEIEDLARHTAAEIDQIVGTLRDRDPAAEPAAPPGLASLDTLVAHHAAAGLQVTLRTAGVRRPLSGAADQAAYRILQQALTNASRHGTGTATVELAFTDAGVDVTVTNPDGRRPTSRPAGGHGLIGMRERALSVGGVLEASRGDGTFRVHAHIPSPGHGP